MKNTAIEKLSYTEVTKNISQAEYNQTQEEYILSKSSVLVLWSKGSLFYLPQIRSAFSASDRDLHHSPYRNNM